jgi:hypothetical protein
VATSCRGMLRNKYGTSWRKEAAAAALLALALAAGGCAPGGVFNNANAPVAEPSSPSLTDRITGFFSTSSAKAPQAVAGAQGDLICPGLEIREGASTLTVGPRGENATMSLKYQGSFLRIARECAVAGGNMVMKIGVQGRVIVGPAGGPGQIDVPLRIAVIQERPGGAVPVFTKLVRIAVTIPAQGDALFSHVEDGVSFPLPAPATALDDYIAYVGFDPLAAEAEDNAKAQRPKPKAKPKLKPGTSG